jgi:hypothetical protein
MYKVGDPVTLTTTGKTGVISERLDGDRYRIRLDGGLGYLPAPAEVLSPNAPVPSATAQIAIGAPGSASRKPNSEGGIQLAFDPLFDNEGIPEAYQLYLLNDSPHRILYEIKVLTGEQRQFSKFGPLDSGQKLAATRVAYGWLNERLSVSLDVRAAVEGGTGPRHFQQLKIRPKQFFSALREVPALSRAAHMYLVFPRVDDRSVADRKPEKSLRDLTRAQLSKPAPPPPEPKTALTERRDFPDSLDLHLNAITDEPAAVPKDKVLELQMQTFERYMDRALRLDVPQVFLIHGVGEGKLKKALHQRLENFPFVRTFHNRYHPKYGYGATEVLFEA